MLFEIPTNARELAKGFENPGLERVRKTIQVGAMSSEIMRQIVEMIEADVMSRPSSIEFEMAYQVRIAIERIRFAIRHVDQFGGPCPQMRDAALQLLDALDRLETIDRRFQIRSRTSCEKENGSARTS